MITDSKFLKSVYNICDTKLFATGYSRTIASWVWEYYNRIGQAPGKDIQDVYIKNKTSINSEDELDLIGEFLHSLNEYAQKCKINNLDYEVQKAEHYFKKQSLDKIILDIQKALDRDDPATAEKMIAEYKRIEKPGGEGVEVLQDPNAIASAFNFEDEKLFKFPGALGDSMGYFSRGDFWAILAPQKTGKTFYLWEIARTGATFGNNVFFISLEMTRKQMLRRAWKSFTAQPWTDSEVEFCVFGDADESGKFEIQSRKIHKKGIDSEVETIAKLQKKYLLHTRGNLRIEAFPSGSADIMNIGTTISNLEYYENFIPDMIVVDYADIISSKNPDYRHRLNEIWIALRGWAQEKNCCIVTASQTNQKAFGRDLLKNDVAEDSRKLATVTHMLGLNQTDTEKSRGLLRVEMLLKREEKIHSGQVVCTECRDIGRVMMDSRFKKDVIDYDSGTLEDEDDA